MEKYDTLAPESRVWIYQSGRDLSAEEVQRINARLDEFTQQWVSHNRALRAFGKVYHNRFVVLMVDETQAGASGCSIDASVHFLQQLEAEMGLFLFDRTTFLYLTNSGEMQQSDMQTFQAAYQAGKITDNTLVFDNLVKTKREFEQDWQKPLAKSWHYRFVN